MTNDTLASGRFLLLVEDNRDEDFIIAALDGTDMQPVPVYSSASALHHLSDEPYLSVVLFLNDENDDSWALLRQMKASALMSSVLAFASQECRESAYRAGANDVLGRDAGELELSRHIKSIVELSQARHVAQDNSKLLTSLTSMMDSMADSHTIESVVDSLFSSLSDFINCDRIAVALFNKATGDIVARYAKSNNNIVLSKGYSSRLADTTLEIVHTTAHPRVLNDLVSYLEAKPESDATRKIVEEGMRSSLTLPLKVHGECLGFAFFNSTNFNAYSMEDITFFEHASSRLALAIGQAALIENLILGAVNSLAEMGERRDMETGRHMKRLAEYSRIMGQELMSMGVEGLNQILLEQIFLTAPLHDIGKVSIPDSVLLKPGKLTSEEFEVIKGHVLAGADILNSISEHINEPGVDFFETAIDIAISHHERYDGGGYPHGLSGDMIPISARIVSVADVFDALMSKRHYKPGLPLAETTEIIIDGRGTQFDPYVVEAFIKCHNRMAEIWQQDIDSNP